MVSNPEFVEEYRKTGYMGNQEHIYAHHYREEPKGELGVTVKTYMTSKDRANKIEKYYKAI